ncbi:MAG: hypothetical protein HYU54_05390, partial [Actinobacteria bacterium]|nr:hypothetical protein [Actinomycetota bacterium]
MAVEPPSVRTGHVRRWGRQTSLFQVREPAFWVYAAILAGTGWFAVSEQTVFRRISPSGWA